MDCAFFTPVGDDTSVMQGKILMGTSQHAIRTRLVPLFTISGVAALVYQVCWQRLLFSAFGVDIESITIIVSAFMLGLGIGALIGGELADRFPEYIIGMFSLTELAIGIFGFFSPWLIITVAAATVQGSHFEIAAANFLLLLFPTTLMGATLPMLVAHVMKTYKNVGVSIGLLYFVNTLGAAIGAAATGFIGFYYFGLNSSIFGAATLNIAVSSAAFLMFRKQYV